MTQKKNLPRWRLVDVWRVGPREEWERRFDGHVLVVGDNAVIRIGEMMWRYIKVSG